MKPLAFICLLALSLSSCNEASQNKQTEKRNSANADNTQVKILDTLFTNDQPTFLIVAKDNDNETEAYLVQYNNQQKIVFWDIVYYADFVEYFKTINTNISGKKVTITTKTDTGESKSEKTLKYVLNKMFIFEMANK